MLRPTSGIKMSECELPFLLLVVEVRVAPEDGKVCMGQRAARAVKWVPVPVLAVLGMSIYLSSIRCVDIYLVSGV